MRATLRGHDEREIPFAQPGSLTRVYAIASGKGGVGKSSVTANLAVAMAQMGLTVGLVDADVYGHSIPRMLGAFDPPTMVEGMIMPPQAYGVRVISMLPFKPGGMRSRWRSAVRCCIAPSSSSWPTCGGATSTSCCSTCHRARATSRSRQRSSCPVPRSWS